MSSFRKTTKILRESAGAYVNGVWAAGSRTMVTALTSIQPIVMGQDLQAMPDGRRLSDFIKIYTSDILNRTEEGEWMQPDIIVSAGCGYEIVSVFTNQSNVINHYKYVAVKVFKFTSDADWLSGALKRP